MVRAIVFLAGLFYGMAAMAATYTIPTGPLPPGCSVSGSSVVCPSGLDLANNDTINVDQPTTLQIDGDFGFRNNLSINVGGAASNLSITVTGNVDPGNNAVINASLEVLGSFESANNADFSGSIEIGGDLTLGNNATIDGNITVGGTLDVGNNTAVNGNIEAHDVYLGQNTLIDGNINATGEVVINGRVTGYVNAPSITNNGTIDGLTCDINANVGPCMGGGTGVDHYLIDHAPTALTCEAVQITVTACADASCSATASPAGSVTVSASGQAGFTGSAAFVGSSASLTLAITQPGVYTLDVTQADVQPAGPTQCSGAANCELQAVETGFQFSPVTTRTAGSAFQQTVTVVRTDNQTGACQTVAADLDQIELSLECIDPGQCTDDGARFAAQGTSLTEWPEYTAAPVSFDNTPSADLPMGYEDVGRIRLHARASLPNGAGLVGSSAAFVVRPASVAIDISNTAAYGAGIFARAGDPLMVLLMARSATGATTPNFGNESSAERLTLATTASTVAPDGGVDGTLAIEEPFIKVSDGVFGSVDVRYREAGTVVFHARVASGDYLGTGPLETSSAPYGRFLPWSIAVDLATNTPACSSGEPPFTYLGQPQETTASLSALNRSGQVTVNYPDEGAGTGLSLLAHDLDTDTALGQRIEQDVIPVTWNEGLGLVQNAPVTIGRHGQTPDGPFRSVQLAVYADPADGDGAHIAMHEPDAGDAGDDCDSSACYAVVAGQPGEWVFGRLVMPGVYGPENEPVTVLLEAEAYEGGGFFRHRADECTDYGADRISVVDNPDGLVTVPDGPGGMLEAGRSAGDDLLMSAPGEPGVIHIEYEAPSWMRSQEGENPETTVSFGRYRGHDRIIFQREIHGDR